MNKESKLNLNASYYAISHCDTGKTYNGLEVHKMLCDAYIAGNNDNDEEIRRALINVFTAHKDYEIFLLGLKTNTNETTSRDEFAQSVLRGAAINLITWIDYHAAEGNMCLSNMECKDVEDALVSGDWNKIYAYMKKKLEKQDEQKSDDKIEPTDYNSIDPHFGKSIDKDEPKFHEGDWIIRSAECFKHNTYLIKEAKDYYVCEELKGRRVTFTFNDVHKNFKLWTISDAKDGDVLCYETKDEFIIFIYKNGHAHYHCCYSNGHLTTVDSFFVIEKYLLCYLHPATKEQRDALMKAMDDAGYTFDFEKKELKKIESKFKVGNWYQCIKDFFGKGVSFDKNTAYYCAKEGCLQNEYGCHIAIVKELYDNFKLWDISDAKEGDILVASDGSIFLFAGIRDTGCLFHVACRVDGHLVLRNIKSGCWESITGVKPATKEQCDVLFAKMEESNYKWDANKKKLSKIEQKKDIYNKLLTDFEYSLKHIMEEAIECGDTHNLKADADMLLRLAQKSIKWSEEDERIYQSIIDDTVQENQLDIKQIDWLKSIKRLCTTSVQNMWKPSKEQIVALRWVLNNIPYNKHKEEITGLLDQIKDL